MSSRFHNGLLGAAASRNPRGEMPFLDHLEELRWRIFKAAGALLLGTLVGFYLSMPLVLLLQLSQVLLCS